ncbi:hypothetical protein DFJ74DRAFT_673030 [Hyaloraphidium curvatum]|nr:hypothetical protein DFJ74DRAFT_673030 [Hyaloraphidium curvatum]
MTSAAFRPLATAHGPPPSDLRRPSPHGALPALASPAHSPRPWGAAPALFSSHPHRSMLGLRNPQSPPGPAPRAMPSGLPSPALSASSSFGDDSFPGMTHAVPADPLDGYLPHPTHGSPAAPASGALWAADYRPRGRTPGLAPAGAAPVTWHANSAPASCYPTPLGSPSGSSSPQDRASHHPRKASIPQRSASPPVHVPVLAIDLAAETADEEVVKDRTFKLDVFTAYKDNPRSLLTPLVRRPSFEEPDPEPAPAARPAPQPKAASPPAPDHAPAKPSNLAPQHKPEPPRTRERSSSFKSDRSAGAESAASSAAAPRRHSSSSAGSKRPADDHPRGPSPPAKKIRAEFGPGPVPEVEWKGVPLTISPSHPLYDRLEEPELRTCEVLRLWPDLYLKAKETILERTERNGFIKKKDAKKLLRIDVNKTGKLYDWFVALKWIPVPGPDGGPPPNLLRRRRSATGPADSDSD